MPPVLALALCSLFVIYLVRKESLSSKGTTPTLWIPTIWMLFISSKPLGLWFQMTSANPESGSPIDRAFLTALMFVAMGMLIKRRLDWHTIIKDNIWLIALLVFMLISISWSGLPLVSFKRWVREFQAMLMALLVLSEPSPRLAVESILRRTSYILIPFSLLLIKYFPVYGIEYGRWSGSRMWIGVTQQKNGLGRLCMISIFFLLWSYVQRRQNKRKPFWKYEAHAELLLLGMTAVLMMGPNMSIFYSATSLYSLCAGLLIYIILLLYIRKGRSLSPYILLGVLILAIFIGTAALFTGGSNIAFVASSAGRNTTLTGRTDVWAALLPVAMKNPIMGQGFGSFWTPRTREYFQISGGHSGYLDILLGLGLVGLFLTSLFLISTLQKAHRIIFLDFDISVLCICFIFMAVLHNIAESSFNSFNVQLTAIILFISVSLKKHATNEN